VTSAPTFVRGVGVVTAAGVGRGALVHALADPEWQPVIGLARPDGPPLAVAACPQLGTLTHLPPLVARRLDRAAKLLSVAAREATGGVREPAWPLTRTGITAGTWNAGTTALVDVLRAVFLATPEEASPMQFPSTVANAPASQLGILESFSGPNVTFCEKQAGGLRAIEQGARLIGADRADAVLACGIDEAHWLNAEGYERLGALRRPDRPGMVLAEGAVVLVVAREAGDAPLARLVGAGSWSVPAATWAYPTDPEAVIRACRIALERGAIAAGDIDLFVAMRNGSPRLTALEATVLEVIFGAHRPAVLAPAERFGEGAFAGALRAAIATLVVSGNAQPRWPAPPDLAARGYRSARGSERTALVVAQAGGGSAVALVFTAA
jgi:3-oxoacyl-(acyl-carrier-protein) synthase